MESQEMDEVEIFYVIILRLNGKLQYKSFAPESTRLILIQITKNEIVSLCFVLRVSNVLSYSI